MELFHITLVNEFLKPESSFFQERGVFLLLVFNTITSTTARENRLVSSSRSLFSCTEYTYYINGVSAVIVKNEIL